jgi:predicted Zn finger-like uncharacterized protein
VYTQCSKCETVFKLSAEALRTAGGQVRCGRCGEVFNALQRLAEDASGFAAAGESPFELEARADSILESVVVKQADAAVPRDHAGQDHPGQDSVGQDSVGQDYAAQEDPDEQYRAESVPAGVEIAHLEILDLDDDDDDGEPETPESAAAADRSMEFSLPPGELHRIFIETKRRALRTAPQDVATAAEPAAEEAPLHPESALARGFEVSEAVRREMLAGIDQAAQREVTEREPPYVPGSERRSAARRSAERRDAERRINGRRSADRRPFMLWLSGAIVAAFLLLVQIVHFNRERIMAHGPFGGVVRALYSAFGSADAPANLSAYQLRQWGVTGDPGANGTLRVRASILNVAAEPQPYPLLRVTLANRFGNRIGARDFEPAEYLGRPSTGLLGAGVRVDATLEILDPGKEAEGFEIDVCLRQSGQRISCAGDAAAQMKK